MRLYASASVLAFAASRLAVRALHLGVRLGLGGLADLDVEALLRHERLLRERVALLHGDELVLLGLRELAGGLRLGVRPVGLGLDGGLLEAQRLLALGDLLGGLDAGELAGAGGLGLAHLGDLAGAGGLGAAEVREVVAAGRRDVGDVEQVDLEALLDEVGLGLGDDAVGQALAVGDDLLDRHVADDRAQRALERLLDDLGQQLLLREEALGRTAHAVFGAAAP